jgi:hypothetical protein
MRNRTRLQISLLSLLLGTVLVTGVGDAAQASSPVTFRTHITGVSVNAFVTRDIDECTQRAVQVESSKDELIYRLDVANFCVDEYTQFRAVGRPSTFDVTGNLDAVHVVATLPLFDASTGEPVGTVHLDETWVATGPRIWDSYRSTFHLPGEFMTINRFKGVQRDAEATGTEPWGFGIILKGSYMLVEKTFS